MKEKEKNDQENGQEKERQVLWSPLLGGEDTRHLSAIAIVFMSDYTAQVYGILGGPNTLQPCDSGAISSVISQMILARGEEPTVAVKTLFIPLYTETHPDYLLTDAVREVPPTTPDWLLQIAGFTDSYQRIMGGHTRLFAMRKSADDSVLDADHLIDLLLKQRADSTTTGEMAEVQHPLKSRRVSYRRKKPSVLQETNVEEKKEEEPRES